MNTQRIIENTFFFAVLIGVGYLLYVIFSPYLSAIFIAVVLAVIFEPLHKRILHTCGGRKTPAAFLSVIVVLFAILLPLSIITILLFEESVSLYSSIASNGGAFSYIDAQLNIFEGYLKQLAPALTFDFEVQTYAKQMLGWIVGNINGYLSAIMGFIVNLFIMVLATYFLFKDGPELRKEVVRLSPFSDEYDEKILDRLAIAVNSGIKGIFTIAILQGFLTGVGFAVFGLPNPVLWGLVASFAALVPTIGTGIITVPAGAYLLFHGSISAGIGMLIWGVILVGLIDNLLRPFLIKRGIEIHQFLILLSIFGGLVFFGPIGVLAGPVVVAFMFALLDVYPHIVKDRM